MVRNLKLIKKAKSFKKKLFSIICQKEKLIRAHCKYARVGEGESENGNFSLLYVLKMLLRRGGWFKNSQNAL